MKSLSQMIKQIDGLADTKDVNDWENQFIKDVVQRTAGGNLTTMLTPKQITVIERLHGKHFA